MFSRYLGLIFLTLCSAAWASAEASPFSEQQTQWIDQHPKVSICYSNDFPPNLYLNKLGQPAGYIPELYALLGEKLGIEFELQITPWPEAVIRATNRECEGLALVRKLDHWRKDFIFSD